jgi:hypothetical protein
MLVLYFAFLIVSAGILISAQCDSDDDGCNEAALDAYYWNSLGSFGEGYNTSFAIVIDPADNKPVVTFMDVVNWQIHVQKWDTGTSWDSLGTIIGEGPSIAIDPSDNKPVIVFTELNGSRAQVQKWDTGTTWTDLGFLSTGNCEGWWRNPTITIDPSDNKPVVAFGDDANDGKVHVMKWDTGTTWTDLGFPSSGVGYYPSIAIDPSDDKPVVAFVDVANGERSQVKKWDSGITWTNLGNPSTIATSFTVLAIDPSDNKPIVAFLVSEGNRCGTGGVQVKKWDSGTNWTDLGFPSPIHAEDPSIVIDPTDNKPVVAIRDWQGPTANNPNPLVHVKKWSTGTSWEGLGFPGQNSGDFSSIAIDPSDNKPIVIYTDEHGDTLVHVAKHP